MARCAKLLTVLLALGMVVSAGCSRAETEPAEGEQEESREAAPAPQTPEEEVRAALDAFTEDLEDGDFQAAMGRVAFPEELADMMHAGLKAAEARERFAAKLNEAYGEGAAESVLGQGQAPNPAKGLEDVAQQFDEASIEITGDGRAKVTHPDEAQPLILEKKDGEWVMTMPEEDVRQMSQMSPEILSAMTAGTEGIVEVMEQMELEIGTLSRQEFMQKFGETMAKNPKVQELGKAMGEMMQKAMEGQGAPPTGGE